MTVFDPFDGARCACGLVSWEDECVPDCPRSGPNAGRADFELTVRANYDPDEGLIAVGNDGVSPAAPSDFVHVRRWLLGVIQGTAGQLPAGWDVTVRVNAVVDEAAPVGRPDRPPVSLVPPPVDRLAVVEQAYCASCGLMLRRDSPEAVWYHVPSCTDPDPVDALEAPDPPALAP